MGREARIKREAPKGNPVPVSLMLRIATGKTRVIKFSDRHYVIDGNGTYRRWIPPMERQPNQESK